jgi:hypothetical protein
VWRGRRRESINTERRETEQKNEASKREKQFLLEHFALATKTKMLRKKKDKDKSSKSKKTGVSQEVMETDRTTTNDASLLTPSSRADIEKILRTFYYIHNFSREHICDFF